MESKKRKEVLYLMVHKNFDYISFSKDVIRLLGYPRYITIKINKKLNSIAVFPCTAKGYMSFKVPEKLFTNTHEQMRIWSKEFIIWMNSITQKSPEETYQISGEYSSRHNLVYFPMKPRDDMLYS